MIVVAAAVFYDRGGGGGGCSSTNMEAAFFCEGSQNPFRFLLPLWPLLTARSDLQTFCLTVHRVSEDLFLFLSLQPVSRPQLITGWDEQASATQAGGIDDTSAPTSLRN